MKKEIDLDFAIHNIGHLIQNISKDLEPDGYSSNGYKLGTALVLNKEYILDYFNGARTVTWEKLHQIIKKSIQE